MGRNEFDRCVTELETWCNTLGPAARDYVAQARKAMDGDRLPDTTPEQMAELCLRQVYKVIIDCMSTYDATLRSLGFPGDFERLFALRALENAAAERDAKALEDWRSVVTVIDGYRQG